MRDLSEVLKSCTNLHWLRPDNALWVYSFYEAFADVTQKTMLSGKRTMDLGCGDGTTSFIMLDGVFGSEFDVFHDIQASQPNIQPDLRRSDSGSLYDEAGDFYNTYSEKWSNYLSIVQPTEFKYDYGTDWKESLLKKADTLGAYKSLSHHDANLSLPFEDSSFDYVFSTIIYWLDDTQKAMCDIARILDKDGVFAFSCPNEFIPNYTLKSMLKDLNYPEMDVLDRGRDANWVRHARSRQEWEKEIKTAGLRILDYKEFHSSLQIMLGETTIRTLIRAYNVLYERLLPDHEDIFMEFKTAYVEEMYKLLLPFADKTWVNQKHNPALYHAFVVQKPYA
jgi:SAM-dependent methyltransferase